MIYFSTVTYTFWGPFLSGPSKKHRKNVKLNVFQLSYEQKGSWRIMPELHKVSFEIGNYNSLP